MKLDRRELFRLAAGGALACSEPAARAQATPAASLRAIAFDAFPIFDPRPVAELAESLLPGKGEALMNAWRTRQFEYQWLRVLSGRYADFLHVTEESLQFADRQLGLELSGKQQQQLLSEWSNLKVWPDAGEAMHALRQAGLRLVVLSNMTAGMLVAGLKKARLDHLFEAVLSTDQIRSYKPEPKSYQLATDRLQLRREEILFAAFAGWDVAGARWFGYPTFWVNRITAPAEELGVQANAAGRDLHSLVRFVLSTRSEPQRGNIYRRASTRQVAGPSAASPPASVPLSSG